jgi:hypothetical protein
MRDRALTGLVIISLSLACLLVPGQSGAKATAPSIEGIWWYVATPWDVSPPGLGYKEYSAPGRVISFCPGGKLLMIGCLFRKGKGYVNISPGDGLTFYDGTWTQKGSAIEVTYRKVSADILREGETLPGPPKVTSVLLKGRSFELEGQVYKPTTALSKKSIEDFLKCFS